MSLSTLPRIKTPRDQIPAGSNLCEHCTAKCCKYFALPIEEPTDRADFEYMRWFLLHEAATVFTEEETWYLLVHTTCKHLLPDNRCGIYETRPPVCREYSTENCEYEDSWVYDRYFETAEQVAEYAEVILPDEEYGIRSRKPALLPVIG